MTISKRTTPSDSSDRFYLENFDQKKILRRFLHLNNLKLQRTKDSLKRRQVDILQLLPLIFHINHPLLPGFVSTQCPAGIAKFIPDKDAIQCARRLARSFEFKRRAYRQYDIHALYFMGSTGTIAYSDKSDFDVWVCHREDLSSIELKELQLKTERISQWSAGLKLEVNFFLMNTEHFRQGKIDKLSSESSGSTQHMLLLEEFYRTSILLAGRYPIWWLVPPQFEKSYDEYVQNIVHQRLLNEHNFLNFGAIDNIPAEEFYGATLWHIYKGIDSPYKSILKLLLMECYAKEHPDIDLLSWRFKRAVYSESTISEGKNQENKAQEQQLYMEKLDPYIMMMEKISEHLLSEDSSGRLELARQCLYLKVNESLTQLKNVPSHEWRQQIMHKLVCSWRWQRPKLISLDQRSQWKIDEVVEEHKNIIDALTYSYRKLSDFFRYQNKGIRISKRDLHILGRKLYAAFEKKAGKIEVISHDNEINLYESHVSLHPLVHEQKVLEQKVHGQKVLKQKSQENKQHGWALYVGAINTIDDKTPAPVKKSTHLLKLLCWGYFNRVISSRTSFILAKKIQVLNLHEIKQIIEALEQTFPNSTPGYASMEDLVKPAQLGVNILFLNIGIDPFLTKHPGGTQIATKLTDALNYSGMHENLLFSIDQVLLTTWREVMMYHFKEENGLLECLCLYLKWNHDTETAQNSITPKRPTLVCCFSSVRGEAISRRISQLFNDVLDVFHHKDKAFNCRYLLTIEESFYLLWQEDTGPKYQKIPDQKELLRELSYPLAKFNALMIDREFSAHKVLKLIFSANKENHIQLFYQNHRKTADIYIIDERGSLYQQSTAIEKNNIHINHFILFLDSVLNRLSFSSTLNTRFDDPLESSLIVSLDDSDLLSGDFLSESFDGSEIELQLEVFEIQKKSPGQLLLEEQFSKLQSLPVQFFRIQVIADLNDDGSRRYSIYANKKEFSSFEHGNDVYLKVAEEVFSTRQNRQRYPIYITDIDLSPALRDSESSHGVQATQLLKFKQEIERRLNQAIKDLPE
ncbi:MAG: class I adenylate cyclase [Gammaproteobacteria bacterium]|nr:class I adenylate cyclase [Gammaproteobacteria bacterium]